MLYPGEDPCRGGLGGPKTSFLKLNYLNIFQNKHVLVADPGGGVRGS